MDLALLLPLSDGNYGIPAGLLPIQSSWSSEPWKIEIQRHAINSAIVPAVFLNSPEPGSKTREMLSLTMSHRKFLAYLYTRGIKEEIFPIGIESVLCVDEIFVPRLAAIKLIMKNDEAPMTLNGTMHRRGDLTLYQALLTSFDGKYLLLHISCSANFQSKAHSAQLSSIFHSGLTTIPMTVKQVSRSESMKDGIASSVLSPSTILVPSSQNSSSSSSSSSSSGGNASSIAGSATQSSSAVSVNKETASQTSKTTTSSSVPMAPTATNTAPSVLQSSTSSSKDSMDEDTAENIETEEDVMTEADVLAALPAIFSKSSTPYFWARPSPKLNDPMMISANVTFTRSPHPYLNTESEILRGRDRKYDEDADRITALHYLCLLQSKYTK